MNFEQILKQWFGPSPSATYEWLYYLWRFLGNVYVAYFSTFSVALILMLLVGRPMIAWLRQRKMRAQNADWSVREDTPESHQAKQGTPSMGGIGIIGSALMAYISGRIFLIVFSMYASPLIFPPGAGSRNWILAFLFWFFPLTFAMGSHALLGYADDWSKASKRGGLTARAKLLWQIVLAMVTLISFVALAQVHPAINNVNLSLGMAIILVIVIVGTSNATNLTDGIDGLAAGLGAMSCLALVSVFALENLSGMRQPINILPLAALAGALLGFLKFNRHPAQVFMGDTGSLAIGAALATAAIMIGAVWLLPFIGFIFYVEMMSVVLQVVWFKWTKRKTGEGRRLFRRAPLHHHFELAGWSEWRVVLTFWGVNLITTILGLVLWHLRILPRWP